MDGRRLSNILYKHLSTLLDTPSITQKEASELICGLGRLNEAKLLELLPHENTLIIRAINTIMTPPLTLTVYDLAFIFAGFAR